MAKQVEIQEVKEAKKYFVTEVVKREGYVADIDNVKFVVTPQITGLTINPLNNNREMGIINKSECYMYDIVNSRPVIESAKKFDGYFENLTPNQERLLKIAGVIEC